MDKKYRVALVGCGGMGRQHLNILREMPEFEVVGVCDVFAEALQQTGKTYGVSSRFSDFVRMYDEMRPPSCRCGHPDPGASRARGGGAAARDIGALREADRHRSRRGGRNGCGGLRIGRKAGGQPSEPREFSSIDRA